MIPRLRFAIIIGFGVLTLGLFAADFAPPAMGPVAFRRDQVPLSASTMAGLSRNLDAIAQAMPWDTAAQRQATARAIALAIALDPANEQPRNLLDIYQKGDRTPVPDGVRLAESQARIWQLIAWLETPEAGQHGQALAACLKDVMVVSDPKHPQVAALRQAGEKGAWTGWVSNLRAYEPQQPAASPHPEPQPPQSVVVERKPLSATLLPKASAQTVFYQRTGNGPSAHWAFALASLQMRSSHSHEGGEGEFAIMIGPDGGAEPLVDSARKIQRVLEKQHGTLPNSLRVRIFGSEMMRAVEAEKIPDITAAAAVLASAAITGREPEAIIIGRVDESAAFKLPKRFWDQLHALGPGNSRRVVLPAAAADLLPALITMENPAFFMDHEVLLASDFRQLLELSGKEGPAADASAKFNEIRARGAGQDLRAYVANRFVRQRLEELVKSAPFHASAAMLLLQGSVNRPRQLTRLALASELRRTIEPMAWVSRMEYLESSSKEAAEFNGIYKSCRLGVDRLERYVDKTDLHLWESSRETTAALWKLNRALNARGDFDSVQTEIQRALADFKRLYRDVSDQLDQESVRETP